MPKAKRSVKNKQTEKAVFICRTCLCSIGRSHANAISNYAKTLNYENMLIIDLIEKCTPELDLEISDDAVICNSCYDLLISTYEFKSKCFQTEEKIYLFIEENNLTLGDKIDLTDLMKDCKPTKLEHVEPLQSRAMVRIDDGNTSLNNSTEITSESEILVTDGEEENEQTCKKSEIKQKQQYLKRKYSCNHCEYKGYRRDLLKRHLFKCKNRNKVPKYNCDKCSYATVRRRHLTRHKLTHGGKRPFICGSCNKGFTEKTHMRYHIMYHHFV